MPVRTGGKIDMKKIMAFTFAAVMLLAFGACGNTDSGNNGGAATNPPASTEPDNGASSVQPTVDEIWAAIEEKISDDIPDSEDLDAETVKTLTGIDADKFEEFIYKYPVMNVHASEFLVAKCKDGELDAVKEQILAHQKTAEEQWEHYLPEQLELVQNYKLETNGNYVFFCISYGADTAAEVFNGLFR